MCLSDLSSPLPRQPASAAQSTPDRARPPTSEPKTDPTEPEPPEAQPAGAKPAACEPPLSDGQALEAIYHRLLTDHGGWSGDTLEAIGEIIASTGRSIVDVEAIEAEMIESSTGWPIAHIHADQVTGYLHQALDGGIVVEVYTRDQAAADRLRILVDGQPAYGGPLPEPALAGRRPQPR